MTGPSGTATTRMDLKGVPIERQNRTKVDGDDSWWRITTIALLTCFLPRSAKNTINLLSRHKTQHRTLIMTRNGNHFWERIAG